MAESARRPFAVWIIAALVLAVHLATNSHYHLFRDELYFLACAHHLAFGYVDFAPLSAFLLRAEIALLGDAIQAVRLLPAIAGAGIVLLTASIARELGGRTWACALGALGAACSAFYLAIGNFYSLNVFEPLFWGGAAWFVVRLVRTGDGRNWLGFGAMVGLGLENKHSMAFFAVALVAALVFRPERRQFAQRWIWLGGAVAFALALPNLIWQVTHGWPTWVLLHHVAQSNKNVVLTPLQYIAQQLLLMNPATSPLWIGGLAWLLIAREGRRYRVLALAYLFALIEFIVMHGKNYYLAPIYPLLFAAGGVAFERWFVARWRFLKYVSASAMIGMAVMLAPIVIPVLPPEKLPPYMEAIHISPPKTETTHTAALPQLFADQFGWEEMTASVARAYAKLTPDEQKRAGIYAQNYGEAGAIDYYGRRYGLPPALSGHQNYFYWGPGDATGEIMLVIDEDSSDEAKQFASVEDLGAVGTSPWAMPYERRRHIFLCRNLHGTLAELWPQLREWE